MKKILLFGGSGLVGSGIKQFLFNRYQIIAPSHEDLDVTNNKNFDEILYNTQPDNIIYAVGLASIDKAQEEPELAYLLNAHSPSFIAKKAALLGIPFLYISTNAVFEGAKESGSYNEYDKTNPISIYGLSKVKGEEMVMDASDKNCVVRLIMPYSTFPSKRMDFVRLSLETLKKGQSIHGIVDQIINPAFIDNIAEAVDALIKIGARGVYHVAATDYVTNLEFINKLAGIFNLNIDLIKEISFDEFFKNKRAPRNKNCWLNILKFKKEISKNILVSVEKNLKLFHDSLVQPPNIPVDILR